VSPPPRLCPDCRAPLREVTARARSGYLLALDQCPRCGGLWFDRWELFPLDHQEVAKLDSVDPDRLMSEHPAPSEPGPCPRCAIPLRLFGDPVLPPDARIARCFVCEGMWLQRGELSRVKARSHVARAAPTALSEGQLQDLARRYGEDAKWTKVADLDAATQTAEEPPPGAQEVGDALRSAAPWLILQVLLRLFLRG
jgi:Zn-finger nucleic acid-binding protein